MSQPDLFDYDALPSQMQADVIEKTSEIKALVKRTAEDVIEIGKRLLEVKARLPHGLFMGWLSAEFGWTERSAQRMMRVSEAFKSDNLSDLEVTPSALYLLAAPSTPESARHEALEKAESGHTLSHADIKAIVESHKSEKQTDETLFLDAFIDEAVSAEPKARSPHGRLTSTDETTERVKFNLMLLPFERDTIIETLNEVKQTQGIETHAQALVWLITDWRTYQQ